MYNIIGNMYKLIIWNFQGIQYDSIATPRKLQKAQVYAPEITPVN